LPPISISILVPPPIIAIPEVYPIPEDATVITPVPDILIAAPEPPF
jgi:hypothetical protein